MLYPSVIKIRRHIHKNPELSTEEFDTAELIMEKLRSLGIESSYCVGKTGVVGKIKNGDGGSVVLRADTDALPLEEDTGVEYSSRNNGVMHACGHDMHTAILLGVAELLLKFREQWAGTVHLIFQPSEEVEPGGALKIIGEGFFPEEADSIFGLHVSADYKTGEIGIKPGDDYSGIVVFDVTVNGKGGHGAAPHETVDPIVCASSMILELQTLVSREAPPYEPAVLTIGKFVSGTKRNVIPDKARFYGTVRTFSDKLQNYFIERIPQILKSVSDSYRATVDIDLEKSYPSGYNNPELADSVAGTFREFLGENNVLIQKHPTMYSEDFAYYQRKVPGLYVQLGVKGETDIPGIHSARFLPDENSIKTGLLAHLLFVINRLGQV